MFSGPGDQRDPPVPELDHGLGDEPASPVVVGDHGVHGRRVDVAVHEHDGDVPRAVTRERHAERRRDVDEPVDRGAVHVVSDVLLDARVRLLVEEDRPVAGERELVVEDVEELRVERVRDVAHDHPDRARPAGDEAAGREVRRVVHLARGLEHAGRRLGGDARVAAERARHRRLADLQLARDVLARHGHDRSMADDPRRFTSGLGAGEASPGAPFDGRLAGPRFDKTTAARSMHT